MIKLPPRKPQFKNLPDYPPPVGTKFRHQRSVNHVVGHVNDGDRVIIVYKYWRRRKQYWQYVAETREFWEICILRTEGELV